MALEKESRKQAALVNNKPHKQQSVLSVCLAKTNRQTMLCLAKLKRGYKRLVEEGGNSGSKVKTSPYFPSESTDELLVVLALAKAQT